MIHISIGIVECLDFAEAPTHRFGAWMCLEESSPFCELNPNLRCFAGRLSRRSAGGWLCGTWSQRLHDCRDLFRSLSAVQMAKKLRNMKKELEEILKSVSTLWLFLSWIHTETRFFCIIFVHALCISFPANPFVQTVMVSWVWSSLLGLVWTGIDDCRTLSSSRATCASEIWIHQNDVSEICLALRSLADASWIASSLS